MKMMEGVGWQACVWRHRVSGWPSENISSLSVIQSAQGSCRQTCTMDGCSLARRGSRRRHPEALAPVAQAAWRFQSCPIKRLSSLPVQGTSGRQDSHQPGRVLGNLEGESLQLCLDYMNLRVVLTLPIRSMTRSLRWLQKPRDDGRSRIGCGVENLWRWRHCQLWVVGSRN